METLSILIPHPNTPTTSSTNTINPLETHQTALVHTINLISQSREQVFSSQFFANGNHGQKKNNKSQTNKFELDSEILQSETLKQDHTGGIHRANIGHTALQDLSLPYTHTHFHLFPQLYRCYRCYRCCYYCCPFGSN